MNDYAAEYWNATNCDAGEYCYDDRDTDEEQRFADEGY